MNITLPITDPDIISALPDTSVFDLFFVDSADKSTMEKLFSETVIRKKLQYLFAYQVSEDIKTKLTSKLINAFQEGLIKESSSGSASGSASSQGNSNSVEILSSDMIKIGNTVYDFKIFSIGNSFFSNAHLQSIFYTQDMLNYVFNLNDESFENAIFKVPEFWDNLISYDLFDYVKTNFPDKYERAINTSEVAFVKMVTHTAALDNSSYNSILELIGDPMALEVIKSNESLMGVMNKTFFGFRTLAQDMFKIEVFTPDNLISKLTIPLTDAQMQLFVNPAAIKWMISSTLAKQFSDNNQWTVNQILADIENNDAYFGEVVQRNAGMNTNYTFTQLLNSDTYHMYILALLTDTTADSLFENSKLMGVKSFYNGFLNLVKTFTKLKQLPICAANNDNSHLYVAVPTENKVKYFDVVFPDATSSQFKVNSQDIAVSKNLISVIETNDNKEVSVVTTALKAYTDSNDLKTDISVFNNRKIIANYVADDLIVILDEEGNIATNKFIGNDNLDLKTMKKISYTKNNIVAIDAKDVVVRGIFPNTSAEVLKATLESNFKDLDKVFTIGDKIITILSSGDIKEVQAAGLADYTGLSIFEEKDKDGNVTNSAVKNGIADVVFAINTMFVLDKKNTLWYKDVDGSIKTIENIASIDTVGKGVHVVENTGTKFLVVPFNNKIRKYDYTYNL